MKKPTPRWTCTHIHEAQHEAGLGKLFEDFSCISKKKLSNFSMYIIAHGKVWFLYKDFPPFYVCCYYFYFSVQGGEAIKEGSEESQIEGG